MPQFKAPYITKFRVDPGRGAASARTRLLGGDLIYSHQVLFSVLIPPICYSDNSLSYAILAEQFRMLIFTKLSHWNEPIAVSAKQEMW